MLCGGPAIHLFSATELERLVCGTPLLDFRALQQAARYDGGYSAGHQVGGRTRAAVSERKAKTDRRRNAIVVAGAAAGGAVRWRLLSKSRGEGVHSPVITKQY